MLFLTESGEIFNLRNVTRITKPREENAYSTDPKQYGVPIGKKMMCHVYIENAGFMITEKDYQEIIKFLPIINEKGL